MLFVRRLLLILGAVALSLLTATAVATPAVLSWSPVDHYECQTGPALASEVLWTPLGFLNSPYGGSANATFSDYPGGGVALQTSNASVMFMTEQWTLHTVGRVLVAGPGANSGCPAFTATSSITGYTQYHTAWLLPPNATSDAGEKTSVAWEGVVSVTFNNSYALASRTVSTCGTPTPVVLSAASSDVAIEVPFDWNGSAVTVPATVSYAGSYTYVFPGDFGTWSVDDLAAGAGAPGGGLAFSFTPCV